VGRGVARVWRQSECLERLSSSSSWRAARDEGARIVRCAVGVIAGAAILWAGVVMAEPAEPWTLDQQNWEQGKTLLPEPVLRRVEKGEYWFRIVPADPERFRASYSSSFWAASAKNEGQYDLDPETCGLRDKATGEIPSFFFGYPFPEIDPADPQAGCKIAWNFTAAGYMGGGAGASFYLEGLEPKKGSYRTIKTRVRGMPFVGYHGEPRPNPDRLAIKATSQALEPVDVEGVSTLMVRHWDWKKPDDLWAYVPATRRARRIHSSARSEPVAGMDIFADDINCYAGKVEDYRWKLVGEGTTLAPVAGGPYALEAQADGPTRWLIPTPPLPANYERSTKGKGAPWLIVDNLALVPRPAWIVEGESKDPYYNFGKVIMYFDKDMYRIYWKLVHNKAGEYFYNAMCGYTFAVSPDRTFSTVAPTVVVGVNDKANRAAIGGRSVDQYAEREFDSDLFTLRALRHRTE
jgi:hypothetical protein